jgi:hypothetical protein
VAAVAGRRVPHRLLAEVSAQSEAGLEQGLREAVGAGVLVTDAAAGSYAFRHALLQEAVYGDLLPGEQVRLHGVYAGVLAAEPDGAAAELAHHCLASHDLPGALAASVRAGDAAVTVFAPAEALRHYGGALGLWERVRDPAAVAGADRVELTLRAAAAASAAGEYRRAAALAQDAASAAEAVADPERAARAFERLGLYLLDAGRVEDSLAARARRVVRGGLPLHRRHLRARFRPGHLRQAQSPDRRPLQLLAPGPGDPARVGLVPEPGRHLQRHQPLRPAVQRRHHPASGGLPPRVASDRPDRGGVAA